MKSRHKDAWPISEVARMAGVSSRTLRHYEERGLLSPAFTGPNGYRFYRMEELLRLQRILLLRRLGLGLDSIASVLAGQIDEAEALAVHHRWLQEESRRLAEMAATVRATLDSLAQGGTMDAQELFRGFEENPYEDEARQRWGNARVESSKEKLESLGKDRQQELLQEARAINAELAACLRAGLAPSDPQVGAVVARHYRWVCAGWTPDRAAYKGLGELYVQDSRFTAFYDSEAPGLAAYLAEAIGFWAEANL
ncbi:MULTISPECIES: TipAS antibiotic-recognition domain-containing protein [unclassified Arthrobacter]|uniref:MerR family transcriptional regulator n=1 Tax=unclassified Arthrobacter TaxID=235627 RepID=UPI00215780E3|nr:MULTISPECIES: TipAS antibiotic-recognition domain-containing protein [unclassified Arthrobacter]